MVELSWLKILCEHAARCHTLQHEASTRSNLHPGPKICTGTHFLEEINGARLSPVASILQYVEIIPKCPLTPIHSHNSSGKKIGTFPKFPSLTSHGKFLEISRTFPSPLATLRARNFNVTDLCFTTPSKLSENGGRREEEGGSEEVGECCVFWQGV